jgi:hypothetical protein
MYPSPHPEDPLVGARERPWLQFVTDFRNLFPRVAGSLVSGQVLSEM